MFISELPGSVFLLAVAAIAKLKTRVRDTDLTHEVDQRINLLLQAPALGTDIDCPFNAR